MQAGNALTALTFDDCLKALGFKFDPFYYLNAANDPQVGDYLVGHQAQSIAWDESASALFAPAGGGKTAMRIYVTRACWVGGRDTNHALPVPYLPVQLTRRGVPPTPDEHLRGIAASIATTLLLVLAYLPEKYLALAPAHQTQLVQLWRGLLPRPLDFYLDVLRSDSVQALNQILDRTYLIQQQIKPDAIGPFCAAIAQAMTAGPSAPWKPGDAFQQALALVRALGFRSTFLLVDGIDGVPETIDNPAAAVAFVAWLFEQAAPWREAQLYVKAFLPTETAPLLEPALRRASIRHWQLVWTPDLLAEVIRRRIFAATEGDYGSLDAISSPALRDVETLLAKRVMPLPREMLVLTRYILLALCERAGTDGTGTVGRLEAGDLDAGLAAYQANRRLVYPPPDELRDGQRNGQRDGLRARDFA